MILINVISTRKILKATGIDILQITKIIHRHTNRMHAGKLDSVPF